MGSFCLPSHQLSNTGQGDICHVNFSWGFTSIQYSQEDAVRRAVLFRLYPEASGGSEGMLSETDHRNLVRTVGKASSLMEVMGKTGITPFTERLTELVTLPGPA